MGVYVYAIGTAQPGPGPGPGPAPGVAEAPVEVVSVDGLRVLISEIEQAPRPTIEEIRRHNAVIEAASAEVTPLPSRFGQWFGSVSEMEASIRDRRQSLDRALERVSGAVEYGVRILDPTIAAAEPDRSSGTAYMEGLARRGRSRSDAEARASELGEALREWLGPHIREQRMTALGSSASLATAAHLVDRHRTGDYRQRLQQFEPRYPDLKFVSSGPWPPYGFVDD